MDKRLTLLAVLAALILYASSVASETLRIATGGRVPNLGNPYALTIEDEVGRTAINLGVYGAPESFLIDPEGIIVHKHLGPLTSEIWENGFVPLMSQMK